MQNNHSNTTANIPQGEERTYQTGTSRPHKEHQGLIALLMILVTFLGGIASALGFLNIRLLQKIAEKEAPADPVAVYQNQDPTQKTTEPTQPAPSIPQDAEDLMLEADGQQLQPETILAQNAPALVTVLGEAQEAVASGVIIDAKGYILTNAYSLPSDEVIHIALPDGQTYRASLVGMDDFTDLAVLYIDAADLTAAQFASAQQLAEGDFLASITTGGELVEGTLVQKQVFTLDQQKINLLQTDLPGADGPVFNSCGQIIGFASPYLQENDRYSAVASDSIQAIVNDILRHGQISGRPCLGARLEELQPVHQNYWQLPQGLRVTQISEEMTRLSGLQSGDILIRLADQPITDRASLCAVLQQLRCGDKVLATVLRDQQQLTLELTICLSGQIE